MSNKKAASMKLTAFERIADLLGSQVVKNRGCHAKERDQSHQDYHEILNLLKC